MSRAHARLSLERTCRFQPKLFIHDPSRCMRQSSSLPTFEHFERVQAAAETSSRCTFSTVIRCVTAMEAEQS